MLMIAVRLDEPPGHGRSVGAEQVEGALAGAFYGSGLLLEHAYIEPTAHGYASVLFVSAGTSEPTSLSVLAAAIDAVSTPPLNDWRVSTSSQGL